MPSILIIIPDYKPLNWHLSLYNALSSLQINSFFCFSKEPTKTSFLTKLLFRLDNKIYKSNNLLSHVSSKEIPQIVYEKLELDKFDFIIDLRAEQYRLNLCTSIELFDTSSDNFFNCIVHNYFQDSLYTTITISNAKQHSSYIAYKERFSIANHIENVLKKVSFLIKTFIDGRSFQSVENLNTFNSYSKFKYLKRIGDRLKNSFPTNKWRLSKTIYQPFNFNQKYKVESIQIDDSKFWADPHLFIKNNKTYCFYEELVFDKMRGEIFVAEVLEDGNVADPELVLEEPYHLSYPFVFEDKGEIYMIPETASDNKTNLYQAKEFPFKWEYKKHCLLITYHK